MKLKDCLDFGTMIHLMILDYRVAFQFLLIHHLKTSRKILVIGVSSPALLRFYYFELLFLGRVEYPKDSFFTYSGSYAFDKFHDRKEFTHTWMQFLPWYKWNDPNFKFPTRANFRF
jgi:hypothetical protein